MEFFATTAKGVESVLAKELHRLGVSEVIEEAGGVRFSGDLTDCYKANLWLRTANHVLIPIKTFSCFSEHELYDGIHSIDWLRYIDSNMTLAVDANVRDSIITHSKYAALKTKDAIVDLIREKTGTRPDVDRTDPDLRVNIHIARNECTVSLDSSGDSLHKRGYRDIGVPAPLKETLAAALVELTEWDMKSPFVDPMCGSGTIVIEAALKAANIAPGLIKQKFGFQRWRDFNKQEWENILAQAQSAIIQSPGAEILGQDISSQTISAARSGAKNAGVSDIIDLQTQDIAKIIPPQGPGIVIVNPPYGERQGERLELEGLYSMIGDIFKQKFTGYNGYVFTGNLELAKKIGLRASRRHVLFNGPIESRLIKFELY